MEFQFLPLKTGLKPWESFNEGVSFVEEDSKISVAGLLEQLNMTRDATDYLWYTTSPSESFGGRSPLLRVQSAGHAMHVFINGQLSGSAFGTREKRRFNFAGNINLRVGTNRISLLSVAVGLQNQGSHFESWSTGIAGPVTLEGLDRGTRDLSWQKWSYKTYFDAPEEDEPLALDMGSMGKGQVWINGQSIGRYWTALAKGECGGCSYSGTYHPVRCQSRCGHPTQQWYHVPRSWLKPTDNLLVVFEEIGGDALRISLMKRSVSAA
ncbi:hypothetical protein CRG98_020102 [Punica granatum]|uniref:Beta-galactosidase galactose-binding domain-containing protein n=1 Tax=Punica granatum TaxID=22663 RepID=A0A2I0JT78_PUNGR|nr:hypothetical protein CRG98_020102 [Punica granatum]